MHRKYEYLGHGGHNWELDVKDGRFIHRCKCCGVSAAINSRHGTCEFN